MSRMGIKYALLTTGIALTAGCVPHLSQQQCVNMDWYQVGYNDGNQGQFQRDLNSSIQDCARFKLSVDTAAYSRGWRKGARAYCNTSNAYQLGVNGSTYNHICPANLAGRFDRAWQRGLRKYCVPATGYNLGRKGAGFPNFCAPDQVNRFRNAYDQGKQVYDSIQAINSQISSINSQISDLNNQINDKQSQIDNINMNLNSGTNKWGEPLTREMRRNMHYQIRDLNRQIMQIRDQISDLQDQRTHLQYQANRYNSEG